MRAHRPAFTLTELLFVILILAVLSALAAGGYSSAVHQGRIERTRALVARLDQLIMDKYESYRTRPVPIKIPTGLRPIGEPFRDTPAANGLTNGFFDAPPIRNSYQENQWDDQPDKNGAVDGIYNIGAAELRLMALRELMRFEMPNTKYDVTIDPLTMYNASGVAIGFIFPRPALNKHYVYAASKIPGGIAAWTTPYEGAECLYLIVSSMRDGEDSPLDFFQPGEIGDIDGDGMQEFHDAWGNPIEFVRWPCGYSEHPGPDGAWGIAGVDDDPDGNGPLLPDGVIDNPVEAGALGSDDILPPPTPQTRNYVKAPDPFDPMKVDGRHGRTGGGHSASPAIYQYSQPNTFIVPFALKPLVYSPGPDREYDVIGRGFPMVPTALDLLDPYFVDFTGTPAGLSAGSCYDPDGQSGFLDNITNHDLGDNT